MDKKGPLNEPGPIPQEPDKSGAPILSKSLSKKILQNISKSYTGEETSKFIVHLGETLHAPPAEPQTNPPEDDRELRTPALVFIDRLFDDFVRYTYEFGTTPVGAEVAVEYFRPAPPKEAIQLAPGEPQVIVEGTLIVGAWTMLVQAQERRLRAFVIPKEYLSGFHARQSFYSPFMEIQASVHNGQNVWRMDEQRLNSDALAKFSKQLFGALIKVSAGELSPTERFRMDAGGNQSIAQLLPSKNEKLTLQNLPSMRSFAGEKEGKANGQEEPRSSIKPGYALELESNKTNVVSACQSLLHSLDNELSRLKRLEQEGFRLEDMKIVEMALSRAGQVRSLMEQIKLAADTWQHLPTSVGELKR
ncbi:MAG: hypothetical protein C5B53_10285 [Candidatus Melainabacteria bacterium]|nr:MAG: hypothetical protein C5B53_10285 [Candidatus Melainabacteria bacterium]